MKFESLLRQVLGLGSSKTGLSHWIHQRISAIALIPLGVWFVGMFIVLLPASFEEARIWFSSPWTVALAVFFILALFYHGYLGMQVIWEDYIPHELTKWTLIIVTQLVSLFMSLLAIVSLLKVFLS